MNKEELLAAYAAGRRDFVGVDLPGAWLQHVDLRGADLRGGDLAGVDLFNANLTGANLAGANLRGAELTGANLTGTDLRDAILMGADLRGAELTGANLTGTNLCRADLSGADLTGTNLTGADLTGADLSGAKGFRFPGAPDPLELRRLVAEQIRNHPELLDQRWWGCSHDDPSFGTSGSVAGWACRLGGGARGHFIPTAAVLLLHCDGYRVPSFDMDASCENILRDLTVPIEDQ